VGVVALPLDLPHDQAGFHLTCDSLLSSAVVPASTFYRHFASYASTAQSKIKDQLADDVYPRLHWLIISPSIMPQTRSGLAKNHSWNACGQRMDTSDSVLLVIYPGIVISMVTQSQQCHTWMSC